uniref:Uncharacterized protein n=1 Tax=Candidatus Kentrum sp. TUN TaxID=2126343 RepID=A0A450ZTB5_9GAMM|nr:MAG: hypothetical protein BECKTUN1418D_GA0071000_105714 [Candidatus Kentron sp. TUN]
MLKKVTRSLTRSDGMTKDVSFFATREILHYWEGNETLHMIIRPGLLLIAKSTNYTML